MFLRVCKQMHLNPHNDHCRSFACLNGLPERILLSRCLRPLRPLKELLLKVPVQKCPFTTQVNALPHPAKTRAAWLAWAARKNLGMLAPVPWPFAGDRSPANRAYLGDRPAVAFVPSQNRQHFQLLRADTCRKIGFRNLDTSFS